MARHVEVDFLFSMVPEEVVYSELSDKAVRIYAALVRHGMTPEDCYPAHARLAKLIGCAERSIQRPLRELEDAGWVLRIQRFLPSGERTSDGFVVRTSSAPTAQESAYGPRSGARIHRAGERDKRKPSNDNQLNDLDGSRAEARQVPIERVREITRPAKESLGKKAS